MLPIGWFGVGSGALLLAALAEWPAATGLGIDRSPAAVHIAIGNAARLGLLNRAEVRQGNWGEGIDERFDLLSVGGSLVTHSWELEASGYLKQPALRGARTVPRTSAAAERLWLEAAAELAAFVRATPLKDATLILHNARWAGHRRGPGGRDAPLSGVEILPGAPADIDEHNALLAGYEAAFRDLMPPMAQVEAPNERRADAAHEWGLSPFHYEPAYYAAIWPQLEKLGVRAG